MNNTNGLLAGKKGLIMGVANNRSIGWGIAKAVAAEGAERVRQRIGGAIGNGRRWRQRVVEEAAS